MCSEKEPTIRTFLGPFGACNKTCADSRRSIGGYVFMLDGGAAVSWKARQQNYIAHSSAEGEFMVASKAFLEAIWL